MHTPGNNKRLELSRPEYARVLWIDLEILVPVKSGEERLIEGDSSLLPSGSVTKWIHEDKHVLVRISGSYSQDTGHLLGDFYFGLNRIALELALEGGGMSPGMKAGANPVIGQIDAVFTSTRGRKHRVEGGGEGGGAPKPVVKVGIESSKEGKINTDEKLPLFGTYGKPNRPGWWWRARQHREYEFPDFAVLESEFDQVLLGAISCKKEECVIDVSLAVRPMDVVITGSNLLLPAPSLVKRKVLYVLARNKVADRLNACVGRLRINLEN